MEIKTEDRVSRSKITAIIGSLSVAIGGAISGCSRSDDRGEASSEARVVSLAPDNSNFVNVSLPPRFRDDSNALRWGEIFAALHDRNAMREIELEIERERSTANFQDNMGSNLTSLANNFEQGTVNETLAMLAARFGTAGQQALASNVNAAQETVKQVHVATIRALADMVNQTAQTPEERMAIMSMIMSASTGVPVQPPQSGGKSNSNNQSSPPPAPLNQPVVKEQSKDGTTKTTKKVGEPAGSTRKSATSALVGPPEAGNAQVSNRTDSPKPLPQSSGVSDFISPLVRTPAGSIAFKAGEKLIGRQIDKSPRLSKVVCNVNAYSGEFIDRLFCAPLGAPEGSMALPPEMYEEWNRCNARAQFDRLEAQKQCETDYGVSRQNAEEQNKKFEEFYNRLKRGAK